MALSTSPNISKPLQKSADRPTQFNSDNTFALLMHDVNYSFRVFSFVVPFSVHFILSYLPRPMENSIHRKIFVHKLPKTFPKFPEKGGVIYRFR